MNNRERLIKAGVRNLKEFRYPGCNEENILTDQIYSAFFRRMLEDHPKQNDPDVKKLLSEIPE